MTNFMSSNDNPTEATSVLNNSNAVHLFQSFIDHTCTANIGKSYTHNRITLTRCSVI